jgi:hypothetical protein
MSLRFGSMLAVALLLAACGDDCGCGPSAPPIATLREMDGSAVARDFAGSVGQWETAAIGASFALGDGVRTTSPSQALLELAGGATLRVRPDSTVRFLAEGAADGERAIDVQTGEALLISGAVELRLRTHVGLAVIKAGSRVLLGRDGDALDYSVELGEARFREASGKEVTLHAGEKMSIDIGMASLRPRSQTGEALLAPKAIDVNIGAAVVRAAIKGAGVMARDRGSDTWRPLEAGERDLLAGTQLRLPAGVSVDLMRGDDRAELIGAGEFVVGSGSVLVESKQGNVRVVARKADVEVIVPGGLIIARAADGGSAAKVQVGAGSGVVIAEEGTITFRGGSESVDMIAGQQHRFALAADTADAAGFEPGPDYRNLSVRAGDSFVVHAPQVPVAIAFDASHKCKGDVAIDLGQSRQRGRGTGSANLSFSAGGRGYTVRCVDAKGAVSSIVARGSVQVLLDAGTRKLPPRAPTSQVDADGRTYSVYYQNQLPDIRVQWPNAPSAAQYTLDVDGKIQALGKPEHVFRSGQLRDGVHRLAFAAGERRSRTTTVEVSFDNAAPTASLSAPSDRGFSPGQAVTIEGVALPAWKVSVEGGTIGMEGGERFVGHVVTSAERPDVAVRLSHPRLGTHYYLRRAASSR